MLGAELVERPLATELEHGQQRGVNRFSARSRVWQALRWRQSRAWHRGSLRHSRSSWGRFGGQAVEEEGAQELAAAMGRVARLSEEIGGGIECHGGARIGYSISLVKHSCQNLLKEWELRGRCGMRHEESTHCSRIESCRPVHRCGLGEVQGRSWPATDQNSDPPKKPW